MTRLYRPIRRVLRFAVGLYFADIQASGQELIPAKGPLIFAANHPNSIMDTVVLGTQTRRKIRYMARSGLFKNLAVRALFYHCGAIPVYRAQDGNDPRQNEESFAEAYAALEEGGCIGIFPEGRNSPEWMVQDLKTGTARIALAAEARNGFSLGCVIQPVGLNFEDRDRFLSRVLIRFGEPIAVAEYAELYLRAPEEAVRELTDLLQEQMRRLSIHIEDERNHELVEDIRDIYGGRLKEQYLGAIDLELDLYDRSGRQERLESMRDPRVGTRLEDHFEEQQGIADAVDFYQAHDPGIVARVRMDVRRYRDHLSQLKIRHSLLEKNEADRRRRREAMKLTLFFVSLGPAAIFGLVNNIIPALFVYIIIRRQTDEAKVAIGAFVSGLVFFPLFYGLQAWALWTHTELHGAFIGLYVLTLPTAGIFFLRWWRQLLVYRDRILSRTFFRTRQNLLEGVERERQELIQTFEGLQARYIEELRRKSE